jgi:aryl-alcohol dehydrogenase-like predicted oxidoreductase
MRSVLPRATDRLPLGRSGLRVSPLCLGMTASPETVVEAYEQGINFFFVTADLHWPLYDGLRKGLGKLFAGNRSRRDDVVVAVVSYLDNPLFGALQFHEVIAEVPGLDRVDLIVAGAVADQPGFYSRLNSMKMARSAGMHSARAIGASFHQRTLALVSDYYDLLDVAFVRYNAAHPGALRDLFPYARPNRTAPVFNFKSVMAQVTRDQFDGLGLPAGYWCPDAVDYYRFVLSRPELDGVLCSPQSPEEVRGLLRALERGGVSKQEEEYMIWLSGLTQAAVMT